MTAIDSGSTAFALRLFGAPQISLEGQPLDELPARKAVALLALLALRHGRPIEREWLACTLWPNSDQASSNLRTILSELRRVLHTQAHRLQSPSRYTLLLDLTNAKVDVLQFDAAIASQSPPALEQAVALYRGPLLEDSREEWVVPEREARRQACLRTLETLSAHALTADHVTVAADYWRRALELDAWSDVARRGLMEALAKNGDINQALHVYREFVELLKIDPRATPDTETSALYRRLRAQARKRTSKKPDTKQVSAQEGSAPEARGNLLHTLTRLIGREDERLEVAARLQHARLVTLTGPGGIGKTRLGLEVAAKVGNEFADGVWFVALETLTDPTRLCRQIAMQFNLKEEAQQTGQATLTDYLRDKRLLLVMDNCEHLLEETARLVGHLLRECVGVRILATSREALEITGETAWIVPALAIPDPAQLPRNHAALVRMLLDYESVQLFMERAQGVKKTFRLTEENARAVAQVCSQLEGIPLAIELAATRIKAMTMEQIAARLDDYLSLLTSGSPTALPHRQTLRATLDWSHALLTEEERALWRRLAVFVGGWDLEAAERVGGGENIAVGQVLHLLTGLVSKSLVIFEEREGDTGGRYRFLETVRQYARERLRASAEEETLKRRHREWLTALAEEANIQRNGAEQERWLNRLETERDNLRATLAWSGRAEEETRTILRLVKALWRFWDIRGYYSEGRRYLQQALERPDTQENTEVRAKALTGAAALAMRQGDLAAARSLHRLSWSIYRQLDDRRGIAVCLSNEGQTAWTQGEYAVAQSLFEESVSLQRELGNRVELASALHGLGQLLAWREDCATARAYFEESQSLFQQSGDRLGVVFTLEGIGQLDLAQGNYREARALFEECLSVRQGLGDRHGIALSYSNLAMCFNVQGDTEAAQALFTECLQLFRTLGDRRGIGMTLSHLGSLANRQGDPAQARRLLEEGLMLLRRTGDRAAIAFALSNLENLADAK